MLNRKYSKSSLLYFPIILVLYEIAIYLSNDAYLPALPNISQDIGITHNLAQLTLTMWFTGAASIQLLLGPITDRIGRRAILLFGGAIFVISTIGCALTNTIAPLLTLRFIQGACISTMVVPGYATIHELFNKNEAVHKLALMNSIVIIAPAFGPLIGAGILYWLESWRWIFGILAIYASCMIIALFFKMPETVQNKLQSKKQISQILNQYKKILLNKSFLLYTTIYQSLFATMIAWITAGPFLLVDRFHFSPIIFSTAQLLIFSSFIIGNQYVKKLTRRTSFTKIISMGIFLCLAGSVFGLIFSLLFVNTVWNMILSMTIVAAGSGLALPVLSRMSVESSPEPMGSKVALWSFFVNLAGMLSSALTSLFYNSTLLSLSLIVFIFSLTSVLLFKKTKNY